MRRVLFAFAIATALLVMCSATASAATRAVHKGSSKVGIVEPLDSGGWGVFKGASGPYEWKATVTYVSSTHYDVLPPGPTGGSTPLGKVVRVKVNGVYRWKISRYVDGSYKPVGFARTRSGGGWNIRHRWHGKTIGYVGGGRAGPAGGAGLRLLLW